MCVYMYMYIYIYRYVALSLYINMYVYIYIYIYIDIHMLDKYVVSEKWFPPTSARSSRANLRSYLFKGSYVLVV